VTEGSMPPAEKPTRRRRAGEQEHLWEYGEMAPGLLRRARSLASTCERVPVSRARWSAKVRTKDISAKRRQTEEPVDRGSDGPR
jgi:hypothetical protein